MKIASDSLLIYAFIFLDKYIQTIFSKINVAFANYCKKIAKFSYPSSWKSLSIVNDQSYCLN